VNIVRLNTEQTPSPSGGGELVMADAGHLFVVFVPMRTPATIASNGHNVAVATFVNYAQMTFGYPNEDAFEGLFPGLVHAFYEITDSDWNARLTKQNRITFPDKRIAFNRRHFLMPFKETTLHVLASELAIQTCDEPFTDVAMGLLRGVIHSEELTVCPRIDE
jgi:hypothetical protein